MDLHEICAREAGIGGERRQVCAHAGTQLRTPVAVGLADRFADLLEHDVHPVTVGLEEAALLAVEERVERRPGDLQLGDDLRNGEGRPFSEREIKARNVNPRQIEAVVKAVMVRIFLEQAVVPRFELPAQHQVQFEVQMSTSLI